LICPPADEQNEILQFLAKETAEIDHIISSTQREIDLLKEYRTRLIADVVTGKLDVRAVAADLPDEAEEPESIDEPEVPDEDGDDKEVCEEDGDV